MTSDASFDARLDTPRAPVPRAVDGVHPGVVAAPLPPAHRRIRLATARPSAATATAMIVVATVCYAFVSFFARRLGEAGIAPAAVAFHRYAITAVVMVRFVSLDRARRGATAWGLVSGLAMGAGWVAYAGAIARADAASVGVVYMTYPLFTIALARVAFGVQAGRRAALSALLIVVAAAIAVGPGVIAGGTLLVAFVAPLTFGGSIAVLTERLGSLDAFERLGAVALGAMAGLSVPVLRLSWHEVVPAAPADWGVVVAIGVVTSLLPMTLYAVAAPSIGAARSAVTGAIELPVVFVIAAALLGDPIRIRELVAGALIVGAISLMRARSVVDATAGGRRRLVLRRRR